jgi:hypothetical protein
MKMVERNRVPRQEVKPQKSIFSLFQMLFAIIGVLASAFLCIIMALSLVSPDNFQDLVMQIYPIDTQEPRVVIITATPHTPLPTSTPLATSTPKPGPPSGDWDARAYNSDDVNILVVNGHIVGASTYGEASNDTGPIGINSYLQAITPNYVTFVNINGPQRGKWGFVLRHDGVTIWGNEGQTEQRNTIGYYQTVQVFSDNSVSEVTLSDPNAPRLEGSWAARVVAANVGIILINGIPATAGYEGTNFNWIDVSDLLYAGVDNEVIVAVWNFDGGYSWDLAIRKDETIVWGSNNQGADKVGEVLFTSFIIDSSGNVIP